MKVLMKPVEMVARFSQDGIPRPVKYKVTFEDKPIVIQVDNILFKTEEKLAEIEQLFTAVKARLMECSNCLS